MYDLIIKGGTVYDGTGSEGFTADVAIEGDRIAEVGHVTAPATRTLDARGAAVMPGFVDVHTHYDGQVTWDEALAPSIFHGVTTAIMGNCGVGFAPVRPTDHQALVDLMEGVEDIPGAALAEGLTWEWETFPEYMDHVETIPHTMDVGLQVPHDALRMYVMGARAVANEEANEEDIRAMREHLATALAAGAVGFSTGRTDNHRDAAGRPTPASEATVLELCGVIDAVAASPHGVVQAVSDFDIIDGEEAFAREFDVIRQMRARIPSHAMSVSLLQRVRDTQQWRRILEEVDRLSAEALPLHVQVGARGIGVMIGLNATFHPFIGHPTYQAIAHEPLAERVATMRDPEFKRRLLGEDPRQVSGAGSSVPPLVDYFLANPEAVGRGLFTMDESFDYEPDPSTSLLARAMGAGRPLLELIYDELLGDDGEALLYFPVYNYAAGNLDAVGEMLRHPLALSGLSDGGAHVGTICDASFPTYLLSHWARDRAVRRGRAGLETREVVHMLTAKNAAYMGLSDRGRIAPGMRADLNVVDLSELRLSRPRIEADLPAGGKRLLQDASGYLATLVAGQPVVEQGELMRARPGRLIRAGQRR